MATKIVVVVEDQDLLVGTRPLTVEVSGGESADAAPDDDKVVGFVEPCVVGGLLAFPPKRMGDLEGSFVAAAHSGEGRGVIVWADRSQGCRGLLECEQISRGECGSGGQCERGPIEKVASCNSSGHAFLHLIIMRWSSAPLPRLSEDRNYNRAF